MNRKVPLTRDVPLKPGAVQLQRKGPIARTVPLASVKPASRITASRAGDFPAAGSRVSGPAKNAARKGINPVSGRRRAENRERSAMADRLWPDRREGTVMCGCGRPECHRPADDLHEPLSRARGGSITDEANCIPLSRICHDEITLGPEWAYRAGLLKHNRLCCQGRRVCSRYEQQGAGAP